MIVDLLIFHFSKWTDKNPNLQVCYKPEKGDSPCYRKGIWNLVLTFLLLLNINNLHPHVCLMELLGQSRFILILWRPQNKALKGWTFPISIIQGKKILEKEPEIGGKGTVDSLCDLAWGGRDWRFPPKKQGREMNHANQIICFYVTLSIYFPFAIPSFWY